MRRAGLVVDTSLGGADIHRAGAVGVAPQEALPLQLLELVGHAGRGDQADRLADLPDARRVAVALHPVPDELQDPALPGGQVGGRPGRGSVLTTGVTERSGRLGRPGCGRRCRRRGSAGPASAALLRVLLPAASGRRSTRPSSLVGCVGPGGSGARVRACAWPGSAVTRRVHRASACHDRIGGIGQFQTSVRRCAACRCPGARPYPVLLMYAGRDDCVLSRGLRTSVGWSVTRRTPVNLTSARAAAYGRPLDVVVTRV